MSEEVEVRLAPDVEKAYENMAAMLFDAIAEMNVATSSDGIAMKALIVMVPVDQNALGQRQLAEVKIISNMDKRDAPAIVKKVLGALERQSDAVTMGTFIPHSGPAN